ncbi:MAG: DHH family phosphoesterase [Candidatus Marsarchaeota archaeon]|nr:DHH family phosphoesterase [Candidatus Marsarchaeota archaeon]MCL5106074.1 DHH family phosphoesterase [Candidatus Marsarchaeota archaeon]
MQNLNFDALKDFISGSSQKRALITFHSMGDMDSVASAFAISQLLGNSRIISPDFITSNSSSMLKKLGYPEISCEFDDSADLVILLDANDFAECGPFAEKLQSFRKDILIIDHHSPKIAGNANVYCFNDESYNSATSIAYRLLQDFSVPVGVQLAKLIAMGIISDSAEFKNSSADTFLQIGALLKAAGTDYSSLLAEFVQISDVKERAKTISEMFSSTVIIKNKVLFVFGRTETHSNIAADDAIKIGADIALFHSISKKEISFSARMRPGLDKKLGVDLGRIMKSIAPAINGTGGGHPCAAGAYGPMQFKKDEFINSFIARILSRIENLN